MYPRSPHPPPTGPTQHLLSLKTMRLESTWAQRGAGTSPKSHSQSMAMSGLNPHLQPSYLEPFLLQSPGSTGLVLRRVWLPRGPSNHVKHAGLGEVGSREMNIEFRLICEGQRQVAFARHL